MKIVVIDTETGGVNPQADSIISLAAVLVEDLKVIKSREWFVLENPIVWHKKAWETHGISLADYYERAVPPVQVLGELEEFINDWRVENRRAVPAGHKVGFDIGFIKRLAWLAGKQNWVNSAFTYHSLDTHSLMRALYMAGLTPEFLTSLTHCCEHFGITLEDAHGALPDALATAELIKKAVGLWTEHRPQPAAVEPPSPPTDDEKEVAPRARRTGFLEEE